MNSLRMAASGTGCYRDGESFMVAFSGTPLLRSDEGRGRVLAAPRSTPLNSRLGSVADCLSRQVIVYRRLTKYSGTRVPTHG